VPNLNENKLLDQKIALGVSFKKWKWFNNNEQSNEHTYCL